MEQVCVSICLPTLNARRFLEPRMQSIINQTFTDWELIVCDSYSDDGTWEYLRRFSNDPRVRLYQVPRAGLFAGWNECLGRARGEYIYIAAADDTMMPQCLEKLAAPLQCMPDISLAVCDFSYIDAEGSVMDRSSAASDFFGNWLTIPSIRNGKTEFLLHACFISTWVTMTSLLFRRSLLGDTGLFRLDRGRAADVEWGLRAVLYTDLAFVPGKLATWRRYDGQATPLALGRNERRIVVKSMEAVLRDCAAPIPHAWRRVSNWGEMIMAYQIHELRNTLRLYRWAAKQDPLRFAKDIWTALREDPKWLIRQVARGFASDGLELEPSVVARELIETFTASWPPRRVEYW